MNNAINNKINFCAGYSDPTRTIKKKYTDYESINDEISKLTELNKELDNQIQTLEVEKALIIQSYQHNPEQSEHQIRERIMMLTSEIENLKEQIENNKAHSTALWYGYHERL